MRLLITAVRDAEPVDLVLDCDDDATVGDVARALATRTAPATDAVLHLVPSVRSSSVSVSAAPLAGPPPDLWWRGQRLEPDLPAARSPLRHGVVVGVGAPVDDVLAEPTGTVEIRIGSGPGAGRVRRLGPGSHPVGHGPSSVLPLADPSLPAVAAWIDVAPDGQVVVRPEPSLVRAARSAPYREQPLDGPIVVPDAGTARPPRWWRRRARRGAALATLAAAGHEAIDPQADIPLLHLDRRPLDGATAWTPGEVLAVGRLLLDLAPVEAPDASLSPTPAGATLDYNRPPRLLPPPRITQFSLPAEPQKPDRLPIPVLMVVAPALLAGAMYWYTKSPLSLIFAGLTPLMAISTYTTGRRTSRRQYRAALAEYGRRTRRVQEDAYAALMAERRQRRRDLADAAELLMTASGPRRRLWERRRTDPDWLQARIGTADAPSEVQLRDPAREDHQGPMAWTAPDVPVSVPLAEVGVTGIAGPDELRRSLGHWIVAQAAVLHSPADLDIVLLAHPDAGPAWSWLRWLPHARPAGDRGPVAHVAADPEAVQALVRGLLAELHVRKAAAEQRSAAPGRAVLVVLDGARALRLLPGMVTLLQDGPAHGLYFLCLDADARLLPEECRAVVSVLDAAVGDLRISMTGTRDVDGVRPDLVDGAWCERVGRALAPLRDVSGEDLAGALPTSSRLLGVLGMTQPDPVAIATRWRAGGRTTRAVIGEGLDGPFAVDLRRDGPHGLIAGTTGSGKSELLQTIIASLAIANRPDECTFVLIDYKGGAAFKDCRDLPHTVGLVTDLDGHLTTRALESLAAELRRREHQLARAGAKDIEDYCLSRDAGEPAACEPMPRLVLVIDEFAALVAELPDFVTGLVDIARRGRSLGVHLLLATQRPAGVVSAEIKSNTNLRIALRVTDANDSQDVIDATDAAAIAQGHPGRAYARLGHSSLIPFQSARVGGRPRTAGQDAAVATRTMAWDGLASTPVVDASTDDEGDVGVASDLAKVVSALREAAELAGVTAPPSPWLPPLPATVTLDDCDALLPATDEPVPPLAIGLADIPTEQRRAPASWDPARGGHLAIIGAPRSGRSTALRAVAGAVARHISPHDVHLYGVDCGNNALLPLVALPHTGAVVTRDQVDRVARLTGRLLQTIAARQQLLAGAGYADVREQRAAAPPAERLPYLVVLFDRWEGFVAAYDSIESGRFIDEWMQILQEGAGVGVRVVFTADRTALVGRLSTLVDDKLVLRLVDNDDFAAIGLPPKQVPAALPDGRGFRAEGLLETQVALLDADPAGTAQVAALQALGRAAHARLQAPDAAWTSLQRPFRIDPLPMRMTLGEARELPRDEALGADELAVCVAGDSLAIEGLDPVEHGPGVLVVGPRRSGRSTTLQVLATQAVQRGWPVVAVTPRQSALRTLGPSVPVFTLDDAREDVTAAVAALRTATHSLLAVDDLELIGTDGWLADLLADHLAALRDRPALVVGAGTTDELVGMYRGPAVALKKTRTGVILAPQAQGDGDIFGVRLPRSSVGGPLLAGRGVLVRAGAFMGAQVLLPG